MLEEGVDLAPEARRGPLVGRTRMRRRANRQLAKFLNQSFVVGAEGRAVEIVMVFQLADQLLDVFNEQHFSGLAHKFRLDVTERFRSIH